MRATRSSRRAWLLRTGLFALVAAVLAPVVLVTSAESCSARENPASVRPAQAPPDRTVDGVRAAVNAVGDPVDRFAVAALDVHRGGAIAGTAADQPFYAASLAKLLVAVDLLDRRLHRDGLGDADDIALIRRMLGPSDDDAMNDAWVRFDGAGGIRRVADALGLRGTMPPVDTSQWGETILTAADMVRVYRHVLTGLPGADRALVVDALSAAPEVAADGFAQDFGLLTLPGAAYAKQGWMSRAPLAVLHSAGVLEDGQVFVLLAETTETADPRVLARSLDAAAEAVAGTVLG